MALHPETIALHGGQTPDPTTRSRAVPIYRTSSYVFKNTEQAANLFALKELGNIYTRIMNPTQDVLEQRVALLEGGAASLALASGTAAIFYAIITLAQAGDEIVSANNLYGGTYTMFDAILPQLGIKVTLRRPQGSRRLRARPSTRRPAPSSCETIGNPLLDVVDLEAIARSPTARPAADRRRHVHHALPAAAHRARRRHRGELADQVAGRARHRHRRNHHRRREVRLEGRQVHPLFTDRRPQLPRPALGPRPARGAGADRLHPAARARCRCATSARPSLPDNAWMFLQGIETLPLRMERHSRTPWPWRS